MKQAPWSRIRGQNSVYKEFLEIVGNGSPTGSVLEETIAFFVTILISVEKLTQPNPSARSSTQQSVRNASRTRSPRGRSHKWKNVPIALQGLPQRNLHHSILFKMASSRMLVLEVRNGCKFGEKCSYAHRQVDEQPSRRSKNYGDKSAVAMLKKHEPYDRTGRPVVCDSSNTRKLGCVFQDMEPPKSSSNFLKSSNILKPIRCVRFTKAVACHANIRDQSPSFGMICLQKSRIRLKKRRNGKSDVPVKQRGSWPKISHN